jgi:predicted RND superfamily exporter protein
MLGQFDCVVLLKDHPDYDLDFIRQHARQVVDARQHGFLPETEQTAKELEKPIQVTYTGVVPIVYKAQRTLLHSLIDSIGWAFVMIAAVMMVLLRTSSRQLLNLRGGMVSMIPNVFPVILIFGAMGHLGVVVDIGTMMTASVAMGVAVDDTIHFLTWFRRGIRLGMDRRAAIREAYAHVAVAMTQTTIIGGLGLSVFAFSTFTPTQRFGIMMLTLLVAALVGDLIILPALLAGPLGRFLCPKDRLPPAEPHRAEMEEEVDVAVPEMAAGTPHASSALSKGSPHSHRHGSGASVMRRDSAH